MLLETAVPAATIFGSEFLGTMILILLGCGVVANNLLPKSKGHANAPGSLQINWGWGFGVMFGVYAAYKTGGHLNPAVTVGLAIAGAMVGFLLSWYGYDAGAKQQSASAINGIVLLFSVIPGIGYLITAGVVRMLKVNREFMRLIQSDLEKRRINYSELNDYQELKTGEQVRKA